MLKTRMLPILTCGKLTPAQWMQAVADESPVRGEPHGCADCPLRPGGEWEANTLEAVADMTDAQRARFAKRWGCHESARPCAGARRIVHAAESPA
jgi:hypothetical protein